MWSARTVSTVISNTLGLEAGLAIGFFCCALVMPQSSSASTNHLARRLNANPPIVLPALAQIGHALRRLVRHNPLPMKGALADRWERAPQLWSVPASLRQVVRGRA